MTKMLSQLDSGQRINTSSGTGTIDNMVVVLPAASTLTDAATVAWDMASTASGINATVTLGGNRTMGLPTNIPAGNTINLTVIQDATGNRTLAYNAAFVFTNGTPVVNTVPGSKTVLTFYAVDSSTLLLRSISSSQANWDMFTGLNQTRYSTINNTAVTAGCGNQLIALSATSVLFVYVLTTTLNALVINCDNFGNINATIPVATALDTSITAILISAAALSATQAVVSYKKSVAAVACQNVVALSVSGSVITVGTPIQVRSTEATSGTSNVCKLDATNFALTFRTNTSNILYCYQGSISGNVITMGSNPLTVETGNNTLYAGALLPIDSTHIIILFRSVVTATTNYLYAAQITFAAGDPSAIGASLQLTTSVGASTTSFMFSIAFVSTNKYAVAWLDTVSTAQIKCAVISNSAGTLTNGTILSLPLRVTTTLTASNTFVSVIALDSTHVLLGYTGPTASSGTEMLFVIFNVNGTTLNFLMNTNLDSLSSTVLSPPPSICSPAPGAILTYIVDSPGIAWIKTVKA